MVYYILLPIKGKNLIVQVEYDNIISIESAELCYVKVKWEKSVYIGNT